MASSIDAGADGHAPLIECMVAGESLVVTRIDDQLVALGNHCPHRGAKLSGGWVNRERRTVVCPYHGFEWSCTGSLARIPSYAVNGLPCPSSPRWRATTYQVIERYGVLWACPAGEPILPLPDLPLLDDRSLRGGAFVETVIHTGGGRSVEGTLDTYHIAFAHRGTIGNPDQPEAPQARVEQQGRFLYMEFSVEQDENLSAMSSAGQPAGRIPVHYQQWASANVVFLLKSSPAGRYGLLFFYRVATPDTTVVYRRIFRDYGIDQPEDDCVALENHIDHEDKIILESIQPPFVSADPHFEIHTVYDKPTLSYRQYMASLGFAHF